jgi:chemotaxis response regulator CheB
MTSEVWDPPASRRELDQLRRDLEQLARRLEDLDVNGTRGVVLLSQQMATTAAELAQHRKDHRDELADRVKSRRWAIGALIGGAASVAAILTLLAQLTVHLH